MAEVENQIINDDVPNRRPLPKGRVYHFNVIYNHARCLLSSTADTELSLAWTRRAVENLQLLGLVNSYYHDRDCPKGQGLVQELSRVIAGSEVTVVVLSPGFVRDCWPRYCLLSCFKSLFIPRTNSPSSSRSSSGLSSLTTPSPRYSLTSTSTRTSSLLSSSTSGSSSPRGSSDADGSPCGVVIVALGLGPGDLPDGLKGEDVLFFANNWHEDGEAWGRLEGSLISTLPVGDQKLQVRSPSMSPATSPRISPREQRNRSSESSNGVTNNSGFAHASISATTGNAISPRTRKDPNISSNKSSPRSLYNGESLKIGAGGSSRSASGIQSALRRTNGSGSNYDADSKSNEKLISQASPRPTASSAPGKSGFQKREHTSVDRENELYRFNNSDPRQSRGVPDKQQKVDNCKFAVNFADNVTGDKTATEHNTGNTELKNIAKQERHDQGGGSLENKSGMSTKSADNDIESAILNRLGQTGIRRESPQKKPITRVFVKGNAVSVDTICMSTPDRRDEGFVNGRDSAGPLPWARNNTGKEVSSNLSSGYDEERAEDTKARNKITIDPSQQLAKGRDTRVSSDVMEEKIMTYQSSQRAFRSEAETSYSSNTPNGRMSTKTDNYNQAQNSLLSFNKHDGVSRPAETTGLFGGNRHLAEVSTPTNRSNNKETTVHIAEQSTLLSQLHSRCPPEKESALRREDNVDGKLSTAAAHTSQPTVHLKFGSAGTEAKSTGVLQQEKDVSSMKNHPGESLSLSSTTSISYGKNNDAANSPHHLDDNIKLSIIETANTKPGPDQTTTSEFPQNTSLEDDHDLSLNEYLSSSLTSDFGTMSPRNLSSLSNGDSGFLSGGFSSFGDLSPQMSTPRSKIQEDDSKIDEDYTLTASGDSSTLDDSMLKTSSDRLEDHSVLTQGQNHDKISNAGEIFGKSVSATAECFVGLHSDVKKLSSRDNDSVDGPPPTAENSRITNQLQGLARNAESGIDKTSVSVLPALTEDKRVDALTRGISDQITSHTSRASRGSVVDVTRAMSRKDSWIYDDLDKGWTVAEALLPLYRVMCYALSRPEMPYF